MLNITHFQGSADYHTQENVSSINFKESCREEKKASAEKRRKRRAGGAGRTRWMRTLAAWMIQSDTVACSEVQEEGEEGGICLSDNFPSELLQHIFKILPLEMPAGCRTGEIKYQKTKSKKKIKRIKKS